MPRVDDQWPGYWDSVRAETPRAGSDLDAYRAQEHDRVVSWFARHWDLLEPLSDELDDQGTRFAVFDADEMAYRFRVIGSSSARGVVRLMDFEVFDLDVIRLTELEPGY